MVEQADLDYERASAVGAATASTEARAVAARHEAGRIIVELANGCSFAFPTSLVEGLVEASADDLSQIEILGDGYGLHWERLDVDYTVPGLLAGLFGTAGWLARKGGMARSPAKAEASRRNGSRGGRPRKTDAPVS